MKKMNWKDVKEPTPYERIGAGGYVCKVIKVEDNPAKEYLSIYYDVAEGKFKDTYKDRMDRMGWDVPHFVRSYKETAKSFFKGWLTSLEKSNAKFTVAKWDSDEQKFVGLLFGAVLGLEEYVKSDGSKATRLSVREVHSAEKIRKGDFEVPDLKLLKDGSDSKAAPAPAEAAPALADDDCPF